MIDSHVHFGQFYDRYTSALELSCFMKEVGAERYAVSSTTMCEENYEKVVGEFRQLISLDGEKVIPVLWITPQLLLEHKESVFLDSGINWRCVKIHPALCPNVWNGNSELNDTLLSIVRELKVPLLIHTGETEGCNPRLFESIVKENADITFILAHGRPLNDTQDLMLKYPNVYADTAFMPVQSIRQLVDCNLTDRVLWGTDFPIIRHYQEGVDLVPWYEGILAELISVIGMVAFNRITELNAESLFIH